MWRLWAHAANPMRLCKYKRNIKITETSPLINCACKLANRRWKFSKECFIKFTADYFEEYCCAQWSGFKGGKFDRFCLVVFQEFLKMFRATYAIWKHVRQRDVIQSILSGNVFNLISRIVHQNAHLCNI